MQFVFTENNNAPKDIFMWQISSVNVGPYVGL